MNKLFLLLVLFFATNEIFVVSQKTENFESKTAHLMEQVLAAVSTKSKSSEDDSTMFNLCSMINEIGQQVVEMSQQELSDYGNVLYSLQQEQSEALKNLTLIKGQYNRTVNDLNRHNINLKPIPSQLLDAKSREQELLSRRNSLSQSCNKDILQQQTRLNGVKSDVYALDQVLGHIEKLRNIVSSSSSSVGLSMLEIESEQKTQRKCRIPELHGQVYRCQNAVALQIKSQNGTLSSMPPGNGMNYHKNLHCAFRISPEGSGFFDRVELTFIGIDTAEGVDFVKVYDGPIASESNLLGSFSGGVTPNSIQTRKSNEMTIVFSKNPEYSEQSFGFAAAFQTIKIAPVTPSNAINSCSKNVLEKRQNGDLSINNNVPPFSISGKNGFISEDFRSEFAAVLQPHNVVIEDEYLNSLSCKWLIQVQGNETVRVHFTFFDTKENQDFIEIYDGDSTSSKLLLTNSSGLTYTPSDVFSTTNNVLITFRTSNFLREGGGFHLSWCVSGSYCPEHFNFALPRPLHASPEPSPAVSESSSPAPSPSSSPFPNRNILLAPVPSPIEKTCCLLNCNQNGICDPTTCLCNCFTSFTGTACSDVILPRNLALIALSNNNNNNKQQTENLIELDSGEFEDNNNNNEINQINESEMINIYNKENGNSVEVRYDECGDDVHVLEGDGKVSGLDLDPLQSIFEKLKYELYRSLSYETDASHSSKQGCLNEVKEMDQDIQNLQENILRMSKLLSDLESRSKVLTEKKDTLELSLRFIEDFAADIAQRIANKNVARKAREHDSDQQLQTLQSMRDIITHIGGYRCTQDVILETFNQTSGVQCLGELIETKEEIITLPKCKELCGFGCSGFSFHKKSGCTFYTSVTGYTSCDIIQNSESASLCSCFQKV